MTDPSSPYPEVPKALLADLGVDGAHEALLSVDAANAIAAAADRCYDAWHDTPNRDAYVGVAIGRAARDGAHAIASMIFAAGVAAGRAQAAADIRAEMASAPIVKPLSPDAAGVLVEYCAQLAEGKTDA